MQEGAAGLADWARAVGAAGATAGTTKTTREHVQLGQREHAGVHAESGADHVEQY